MNNKVLIAGIGNIFLGDDAFGVEVVKRLVECSLPSEVTVADFGIRSYDLAYSLMQDWSLVILIDALPQGGTPGTLYVFEPELPEEAAVPGTLDAHSMDPVAVLELVNALGGKVNHMLVVGCEPRTIESNAEGEFALSAPVRAAVNEAVEVIQGLITRSRSEAIAA
jgi:hydrogenase maturation protease